MIFENRPLNEPVQAKKSTQRTVVAHWSAGPDSGSMSMPYMFRYVPLRYTRALEFLDECTRSDAGIKPNLIAMRRQRAHHRPC